MYFAYFWVFIIVPRSSLYKIKHDSRYSYSYTGSHYFLYFIKKCTEKTVLKSPKFAPFGTNLTLTHFGPKSDIHASMFVHQMRRKLSRPLRVRKKMSNLVIFQMLSRDILYRYFYYVETTSRFIFQLCQIQIYGICFNKNNS